MFWRLHKAIFGDRIIIAKNIIENFGDEIQIVEGTPSQLANVPPNTNGVSLAMTTLQDAQRLMRKDYPGSPWLLFNNTQYEVSYWLPRIDRNIPVLNRNSIFLPYNSLLYATEKMIKGVANNEGKLFIKPNTGNKIFTGFTIEYSNKFKETVENQLMFSKPELETLCVVAPYNEIEETEWRFWIAERKIIAYSPYAWESEPEFFEAPKEILEIAEKMTQNNWQPDCAYVVDFCITKNKEVMLLEINAASTSGVYSAKLEDLLIGLRKTSIREYNSEID